MPEVTAHRPGTPAWYDLATSDPAADLSAAERFYTDVLGWTWEVEDTGGSGPDYRTFSVDGLQGAAFTVITPLAAG